MWWLSYVYIHRSGAQKISLLILFFEFMLHLKLLSVNAVIYLNYCRWWPNMVLIVTRLYKNAGACACVCACMHVCVRGRTKVFACYRGLHVHVHIGGLLQNILDWRNGGPTLHSVENTLRIAKQQCLSKIWGIPPLPCFAVCPCSSTSAGSYHQILNWSWVRTSVTSWLPSFVSHWHVTIRFLIQPMVLVTVL